MEDFSGFRQDDQDPVISRRGRDGNSFHLGEMLKQFALGILQLNKRTGRMKKYRWVSLDINRDGGSNTIGYHRTGDKD